MDSLCKKMEADKQDKFHFINQRNEPVKERVKISNTAKFQKNSLNTHAEWQTFEKPGNKRQTYDSKAWVDWLLYICLLFVRQ